MDAREQTLFVKAFPFASAALSTYNTFRSKLGEAVPVVSVATLKDGRRFASIGFGLTAFFDAPGAVMIHGAEGSVDAALAVRDEDIHSIEFTVLQSSEEPTPFGFHPKRSV